MAGYLELLFRQ